MHYPRRALHLIALCFQPVRMDSLVMNALRTATVTVLKFATRSLVPAKVVSALLVGRGRVVRVVSISGGASIIM